MRNLGLTLAAGLTLATAGLVRAATATFAGGCFWCMEPPFEKLPGVESVVSGYAGGTEANPTYEQVSAGSTGHVEAVQVTYDPAQVTNERLLDVFWHQIDPTDDGGQFVDRGAQYRSVIFTHDDAQRTAAEASKAALAASGRFSKPIVTHIVPFTTFYPAEEYHQDYYKKNPIRYRFYRYGSGRDQFLEKVWGPDAHAAAPAKPSSPPAPTSSWSKPSDETLRARLSPLEYEVTQHEATERPFDNAYWQEKRDGLYVDVVSGEPLFSSRDKYDSGTGWPSFTRPIAAEHVALREDRRLFTVRTEVRSRGADSHLGHVFDDGPPPTGQRYCINSAALRFVPKEQLESEGLGSYRSLFEGGTEAVGAASVP